MEMRRSLLTLYLSLLILNACNTPQHVLKLMEKRQYQDASTRLEKALLKDTLNADIYYVYSLLYTDTAFAGYDIDSSFLYINKAMQDYEATDIKTRVKLEKQLGLDSLKLVEQKLYNDSLAYRRATNIHTVEAYQAFLNQHPDAAQTKNAVAKRNQLAYQAAADIDTYEAYKTFMETYPEAEEYPQAQERYNTLVFRDKTRTGDLQGYLNFLEAFPDSPFRSQAEQQVLEITTASNQFADYENFIRKYRQSKHMPLALNLFFHLYKNRYSAESFFAQYPELPLLDSLKTIYQNANRMLAPVFEDGHYGLMNSEGTYPFTTAYDLIPADYLCEGVEDEVVHLVNLQDSEAVHRLLNKSGGLIYEFTTPVPNDQSLKTIGDNYIKSLGAGLYLAKTDEMGYALLHQSGARLLPNGDMSSWLADAILLPTEMQRDEQQPHFQFISYQVDGLWGLSTFTGRIILRPEYESIETLDAFVVLRKNGKAAVTNRDAIVGVANQRPLELSFIYDDVSLLDDRHVIAYTDDYESVIDSNLNVVVPLDRHNVIRKIENSDLQSSRWLLREDRTEAYVKNDTLLNRTASVYYLYDKQKEQKRSATYDKAFFSDNWLALKNREGFQFINLRKSTEPQRYDSVKLVGENFALLYKYFDEGKDSVTVLFPNERKLALASPENISFLLLKPNGGSSDREYLLVAPAQGPKEVWSQYGQRIMMDKFRGVRVFGPGLFVVEKNRDKGLLDSLGNELLPFSYEEISSYQEGLLTVFDNRKFGVYQHETQKLISPRYEAALRAYGSPVWLSEDSVYIQRFIAREDGQYGIINDQDLQLTDFDFDNIVYWNDTAALVKQEGVWSIYRLSTEEPYDEDKDYLIYQGIEDYDLLEATKQEKLYKIYKKGGYGILSDQRGELLAPTYDDIRLLGSIADPHSIFLAEKYVPEAELYIVIHLNTSGEIIKRQALTSEQYDKVFCDD